MKNTCPQFWASAYSACVGFRMLCVIPVFLTILLLSGPELCPGAPFKTERMKTSGSIHERPAANSPVIAEFPAGTELILLQQQGEWYIVKLSDNRMGWIRGHLVSGKNMPAPEEISVSEKRTLTLSGSKGRVREMPSVDARIKFNLQKGDRISHLKTEGDWYFVKLADGTTGWSHQRIFSESYPSGKSGSPGVIREIRVDTVSDTEENIVFVMSGLCRPETFNVFPIIKDSPVPKLVCDFPDISLSEDIKHPIEVNSNLIQRIRIGIHGEPAPKLRVVTDLFSDRGYDVEHIFYSRENLYVLTFKPIGN